MELVGWLPGLLILWSVFGRSGGVGVRINSCAIAALGHPKTFERYIRLYIQNDDILVEQSSEVPVIDLGRLFDPQFEEQETARFKFACEDWGFCQLVNHGIPEEIITNVRSGIQKFFQLPLEVTQSPLGIIFSNSRLRCTSQTAEVPPAVQC